MMGYHHQISLKVRDLYYHPVMQPIKIHFPPYLSNLKVSAPIVSL